MHTDHDHDAGVTDLYARLDEVEKAVSQLMHIAEDYTQEGAYGAAIDTYKKLIRLDPTRLEVYEFLADLYDRAELQEEAQEQRQILEGYYVKKGSFEEAARIRRGQIQSAPPLGASESKAHVAPSSVRSISMKVLRGLGVTVFSIYIIGFGISVLVFNWQYAKSSGFLEWVFLGQIVPTAKAAIWPYYAVRALTGSAAVQQGTELQEAELVHFRNSIELRNQAFRIMDPPDRQGATWTIPAEDHELAVKLLHRSLSESRKVSRSTLVLLHKELPEHYEAEFRQGLILFIQGIEGSDTRTAMKGQRKLFEFGEWYSSTLKP